jgi:sortase A
MEVLDTRHETLKADPLGDELVLVTCYPFRALIPGGPLRYVVRATPGPRHGS